MPPLFPVMSNAQQTLFKAPNLQEYQMVPQLAVLLSIIVALRMSRSELTQAFNYVCSLFRTYHSLLNHFPIQQDFTSTVSTSLMPAQTSVRTAIGSRRMSSPNIPLTITLSPPTSELTNQQKSAILTAPRNFVL